MEDEWSVGYSSYSFDTPLFLNSLAQEAAGEWQVAKSKKTNNPSRKVILAPCAHRTCECLISKGRYHAISEDSHDLDGDVPLLMVSREEGASLSKRPGLQIRFSRDTPPQELLKPRGRWARI